MYNTSPRRTIVMFISYQVHSEIKFYLIRTSKSNGCLMHLMALIIVLKKMLHYLMLFTGIQLKTKLNHLFNIEDL